MRNREEGTKLCHGVGGVALQFPVTAGKAYSVFVDGAGISQLQGAFRVTFAIP